MTKAKMSDPVPPWLDGGKQLLLDFGLEREDVFEHLVEEYESLVDYDREQAERAAWTDIQNHYEDFWNTVNYDLDTPIRVWRRITAPSVQAIDLTCPGLYWSWEKDAAEAHWGTFAKGYKTFTIVAEIPRASVDWPQTIYANVTIPEEKEITAAVGAKMRVVAIENSHGKTLQEVGRTITACDVSSREQTEALPVRTGEDEGRTETGRWGSRGAGILFIDGDLSDPETRAFLTHRSAFVDEPGTWGIPGGAVKKGQDVYAAALDETTEEIGSKFPKPPEPSKSKKGAHAKVVREVVYREPGFEYTTFVVQIPKSKAAFKVTLNWENDDADWFLIRGLTEDENELLHPGVAFVLEMLYPSGRPGPKVERLPTLRVPLSVENTAEAIAVALEGGGDLPADVTLIGTGVTRKAYRVGDFVVKVPRDRTAHGFNQVEAKTWEIAPPELKQYLLPVLASDPEGRWLIMPLAEGVSPSEGDRMCDLLKSEGFGESVLTDCWYKNVGRWRGRVYVWDYANDISWWARQREQDAAEVERLPTVMDTWFLRAAHEDLNPHVSAWVFGNDRHAKTALIATYKGLDARKRAALEAEVRTYVPAPVTVYRSVRPGQALDDMGGRSVSDLRKGRTGNVHAWEITADDVMLHYKQPESWLASKTYAHEHEIILRPDAQPRYLGPVAAEERLPVATPDAPAADRTIQWNGFPWPQDTVVYHATRALGPIAREGFKTRVQGVGAAAGGRHQWSVSLTFLQQRAASIALGLHTLCRAARGDLTVVDLMRRLKLECPQGFTNGLSSVDLGIKLDESEYVNFDEGLNFAVWYASDRWHGRWLRADEAPPAENAHVYTRLNAIFELYRRTLQSGSYVYECFDPLFIGTDMNALAKTDPNDIGVIAALLDVERVCCSDADTAVRLGFLSEWQGRADVGNTSGCESDIELVVRQDQWAQRDREFRARDASERRKSAQTWRPREDRAAPWTVDYLAGERTPDTTIVATDTEEEVRVFDPTKIRVLQASTVDDLRRQYALGDRLTFPWFDHATESIRISDAGEAG